MAAQTIADRGVSERLPRRLRQPVDTSAVLPSAAHRAELPTDSTVVTKRSAGHGRRINVSHQPSVHHAGSAGRRRRHHGRLTARRPSVGSSRMQLAAIQWQPARSGADADSPPRGSRTSTTAVSRGINRSRIGILSVSTSAVGSAARPNSSSLVSLLEVSPRIDGPGRPIVPRCSAAAVTRCRMIILCVRQQALPGEVVQEREPLASFAPHAGTEIDLDFNVLRTQLVEKVRA